MQVLPAKTSARMSDSPEKPKERSASYERVPKDLEFEQSLSSMVSSITLETALEDSCSMMNSSHRFYPNLNTTLEEEELLLQPPARMASSEKLWSSFSSDDGSILIGDSSHRFHSDHAEEQNDPVGPPERVPSGSSRSLNSSIPTVESSLDRLPSGQGVPCPMDLTSSMRFESDSPQGEGVRSRKRSSLRQPVRQLSGGKRPLRGRRSGTKSGAPPLPTKPGRETRNTGRTGSESAPLSVQSTHTTGGSSADAVCESALGPSKPERRSSQFIGLSDVLEQVDESLHTPADAEDQIRTSLTMPSMPERRASRQTVLSLFPSADKGDEGVGVYKRPQEKLRSSLEMPSVPQRQASALQGVVSDDVAAHNVIPRRPGGPMPAEQPGFRGV